MLPAFPQRKGTLMPGQSISVNNYTVQVERYLSQGGFAHVYLVRTPTPVYNTTHHVLKRIAVANEAMLVEVKKEVDVMRLLKGHPNIVHFIDASWHKLPNGSFEVFILMEYCPGGGIIDMMNRRLRERLTESEILQIFVDVCEGVAYMHNSRPALLHRDLKVENILQSSPTSFKLCDFGSATTISNSPSNIQEIRALEADLNKHTTLQYRAPEMVDVYSKRPINEKSDVWALGVLLYKLCYYTTPFEEHGSLAILNVQYRTPGYPSYSQDMHILIASMLREHGSQRPSVFELLAQVHRLRGTKSKFSYTIPVVPPLFPRSPQATMFVMPKNSPEIPVSQNVTSVKPSVPMYKSSIEVQPPSSSQGLQAREKVLEAIAPMRRGRPNHSRERSSRQVSPQRSQQVAAGANWPDSGFVSEENQAWKAARDKAKTPSSKDDGWVVVTPNPKTDISRSPGFGDDFAEKLWTTDPNSGGAKASPQFTATSTTTNETSVIPTPLAFTGSRMLRPKQDRIIPNRDKAKDAFDGLGLMSSSAQPAPTLGEARKLRTGLAVMSNPLLSQGDYLQSSSISPRPSPSPRQNFLVPTSNQFQPRSTSPLLPSNSTAPSGRPRSVNIPGTPSLGSTNGFPTESRFPSIEELDSRFVSPANSLYSFVINDRKHTSQIKPTDARLTAVKPKTSSMVRSSDTGGNISRVNLFSNITYNSNVVKSENFAGTSAKDNLERDHQQGTDKSVTNAPYPNLSSPPPLANLQRRPSLIRRHRSSMSMKPNAPTQTADRAEGTSVETALEIPSQALPDSSSRDWLTGDDQEDLSKSSRSIPILRESPSKRASFIAQSDIRIPESSSVQHISAVGKRPSSTDSSDAVSRFKRAFPDVENEKELQRDLNSSNNIPNSQSPSKVEKGLDSSGDEGPEDVGALRLSHKIQRKSPLLGRKERQNSVHDLVSQYDGGLDIPQASDSPPRKSPALGLTPPVRQELQRKTPSPTRGTTQSAVGSSGTSSIPIHRTQPSIGAQKSKLSALPKTTPTRSGSRPQSMFIFPSQSSAQSNAASSKDSVNLMPPEQPPRAPRRLSISDMVQKYEAISGKIVSSLPSGLPSPVKSFKAAQNSANGQISSTNSEKTTTYQTTLLDDEPSGSYSTAPLTMRDISADVERASRPRKSLSRTASASWKSRPTATEQRAPVKAAIIPSSDRAGPGRAKASESPESSHPLTQSPRKRTMSIPSNNSRTKDESQSSGETETYQGVGKLIDQWQKKSTEAEQSRPFPKRRVEIGNS